MRRMRRWALRPPACTRAAANREVARRTERASWREAVRSSDRLRMRRSNARSAVGALTGGPHVVACREALLAVRALERPEHRGREDDGRDESDERRAKESWNAREVGND